MKEQAHFQIGGSQIVVYLAAGRLMQLQRGFRFHHDLPVNDHVESLVGQLLPLVHDAHGSFPGNMVSASHELALQGHYICMLEKPEPKGVVYLVERTNDGLGKLLLDELTHTGTIRSSVVPQRINSCQYACFSDKRSQSG